MPPTRFLFWNINRKPLAGTVSQLAGEHRADVVVLAESNVELPEQFRVVPGQRPAVSIYAVGGVRMEPCFDSEHVSMCRLKVPGAAEALLGAVHLPSKLYRSAESQAMACAALQRNITDQEKHVGHQRTILLGDFNMNPFEAGMVGAGGLHGVKSRAVAARGSRKVDGLEYPFFYNPMWNHLGDGHQDAAGTYYYDRAEHVNHFWHTFDQVLIRPELIAGFNPKNLRILTEAGGLPLVRAGGRPNGTKFSDHLPILFALEF